MRSFLRIIAAIAVCFFAASAYAQVQVAPFLTSAPQFFDANGNPLSGGKVCFFSAGTLNALATYSESTGTNLNSNPVVLNSAGFPQSGSIYLTTASYKIVTAASTANNQCIPSVSVADGVTWSNLASTLTSLTVTGPSKIVSGTAATSGANQSSPLDSDCGNYWTGTVSAQDCWSWSNVLGTGANPTSTLTLTHSGSSGATALNFAPPLTFEDINVTGILTAGVINANGGIIYPNKVGGTCMVNAQTAGADLEAQIATAFADSTCLIIDASGFVTAQTWGAPFTINRSVGLILPPVIITASVAQPIIVSQGTNNVDIVGALPSFPSSSGGTVFVVTATGSAQAAVPVGNTTGDTSNFGWFNIRLDISGANNAAIGLQLNRAINYSADHMVVLGAATGTQKLLDLEGGTNFTGGHIRSISCNNGLDCMFFGKNANANKVDYFQATPIAGGRCVNLDGGGANTDGNRIIGGDCENTGSAVRLDFATNNEVHFRSEGNTAAITATSNSANNQASWGGDISVSDSGSNNYFLPTTSAPPQVVCTNFTPATVNTNTTAEQNLAACTMPAGRLTIAGRTLTVEGAIVFTTPAAATPTVTIKVKQCSVSGCATGTSNVLATWVSGAVSASTTNAQINYKVTAITAQTASAPLFEAHGNMAINPGTTTATALTTYADTNSATLGTNVLMTAQTFIQTTITFSTNQASADAATQREMVAMTAN